MKFLGIDYGTKRIGLSKSDERGALAFPLTVIVNDSNLVKEISEIIKKENIDCVVIGESLDYRQERNQVMEDVLLFKDELSRQFKGDIFLQNETLSSKEARNIQGRDENLDARAAAIILQSFLDKKQFNRGA